MKIKFSLLDIRLKKSYFEINTKVIKEVEEEAEFEIKRKMKIAFGSDDKDKTLIKVELQVTNDDVDSPFNFDLIYEGLFKFELPEEIEEKKIDEDIEQICLINCAAIIFPYLREHLADLTRRSGLPPYHLPLTNFVKLYKEKHKNCGG